MKALATGPGACLVAGADRRHGAPTGAAVNGLHGPGTGTAAHGEQQSTCTIAAVRPACQLAAAEEGRSIAGCTAECTVVAGPAAGVHRVPAKVKPAGRELRCTFSAELDPTRVDPTQLDAAQQPGLQQYVMLYHAFFALAVVGNLVLLGLTASGVVSLGCLNAGAVGLIVLSACCLMRSEIFLMGLYWRICKVGRAAPCPLRAWLARVPFHAPGGLHSGCAVAGFAWELTYAIRWWLLPVHGPGLTSSPVGVLASTSAILLVLLLAAMLALAIPAVRHRHHNSFELSHRYMGWSLVAVTWVHIWTAAAYSARYDAHGQPLAQPGSTGAVLLRDTDLWCILAITLLVFHPWLFVRRRGAAPALLPGSLWLPRPRACRHRWPHLH